MSARPTNRPTGTAEIKNLAIPGAISSTLAGQGLDFIFQSAAQRLLSQQHTSFAPADAALAFAEALGLPHTMVLRPIPLTNSLLMQSGTGCMKHQVGKLTFECGNGSLLDQVLISSDVVSCENLSTETRWRIPAALTEYGFASGICVRFPFENNSFGILAGFSQEPRGFDHKQRDIARLIAGMLVAAMGYSWTAGRSNVDHEKIAQAKLEWEATVDALPHFICLLDENLRIIRANRSVEKWVNSELRDVRGYTIHEILHPNCDDPECYMTMFSALALIELLGGRTVEYETQDVQLKRFVSIQMRQTSHQTRGERKSASYAVAVIHDISSLKQAEDVLKCYNEQLEKRIQSRTVELVHSNDQLRREVTERRRIEENLRRSENEMRLMSAQLLTAQEMERKRIAAELHDGIGQTLSAIKFSMENAISRCGSNHSDDAASCFEPIITMMRGAIEEVRRISMDLHPSTLTDLGVLPTIAWFCREFRQIYQGIQLETYIDVEEQDVPVPLKTVIFRIMQEALNNIVKHADADSVRVDLRKTSTTLELIINDNGIGLDMQLTARPKANSKGFGITGMRERADFSGGTFSLYSQPDSGTLICVKWPLQCAKEGENIDGTSQ